MCQEVLDACVETGVRSPGLVWMDGCDYPGLRLPPRWTARAEREHLNIGAIYRQFFAEHPSLPWYGMVTDDCLPRSMMWDIELIRAAGSWAIAYPDDDWLHGLRENSQVPHVTSLVCFGGELLRAIGFWALPGQVQMYIDDVWESIAAPLNLLRYCPEIKSEHRHFANGKRPTDATDTREFRGLRFPAHDRQLFTAWKDSPAYSETLERVRARMTNGQ
jgi:hypothetical protein